MIWHSKRSKRDTRIVGDTPIDLHNHFEWVRTALGLRRTLMGDIRTAVSLIGFGFSVAQFFRHLIDEHAANALRNDPDMPRNLGLLLIAVGVASLGVSTWNYWQGVGYLKSPRFAEVGPEGMPFSRFSYLVAFAVMLIGLIAFGSVLVRF